MQSNPASIKRSQKLQQNKMQEGTIISFTTVRHPPAGFPSGSRTIGLIQLEDGTVVTSLIRRNEPLEIGMRVCPRMALTQVRSDSLRQYDIIYEPLVNSEQHTKVFQGYILALTGPSGVGKSTVNSLLASVLQDRVANVPIVTTRQKKAGDNTEYEYVTIEEFQAMRKNGELVAAVEIPSRSEKRWYGYRKSSIAAIWNSGKIPTVVTEMHLLQDLETYYGRRTILSCGLLPPGNSKRMMLSTLLHRLRKRGRDSEKSIEERIENAKKDLLFFDQREDLFDHLIVNDDVHGVVDTLKGHVMNLQSS